MRTAFVLGIIVTAAFLAQGCKGGEITSDQQKAKKNALAKYAKDHADPNDATRPGRS